MMVIKN